MAGQKEPQTSLVRFETRDFWCEGEVVMPSPGGYKGRLLDLLNGAPPFIAVTGALVHRRCQKDEEEPVEYDVLLLGKDEIQFVVPLD